MDENALLFVVPAIAQKIFRFAKSFYLFIYF